MIFSQLLRAGCLGAALSVAFCAALPAGATSFTSSASSAGSASSGSVSDSLGTSSNSASGDKKVAEGNYRIIDMALVPERPGIARLTLVADKGEQRVELSLPQKVVHDRSLGKGELVHAQHRAYGIEFSSADTREPFYLVLADKVHDQMAARPVTM